MRPEAVNRPKGFFMGDAREQEDRLYMTRAMELARRGEGATAPNPLVGCVLVRDGAIVGEGWHARAGAAHAEIAAIEAAGRKARGATLYVTLEPCNHTGRTPPCTDAIVKAGVERVIYGMADPNREAAGGAEYLRKQRIAARYTNVCMLDLAEMNRFWLSRIKRGRPYVIGKLAMSLDGRIATRSGESKWITGQKARAHAHLLRHRIDAIIVGAETVIADDPSLTARHQGDGEATGRPLRVVLDTMGRTSPGAAVYDRTGQGALLATTARASKARLDQYRAHGVEIVVLETDENGRPDAAGLVAALYERGHNGLLVEGGASLHGSFMTANLYDEVHAYIAPMFIGGDGRAALAPMGVDRLKDALSAAIVETRQLGADSLMIARMTGSRGAL